MAVIRKRRKLSLMTDLGLRKDLYGIRLSLASVTEVIKLYFCEVTTSYPVCQQPVMPDTKQQERLSASSDTRYNLHKCRAAGNPNNRFGLKVS